MVTKPDRLARSVPHMWEIVQRLQAKGVALRIVNLGIDTATPTGKLMLNVLLPPQQSPRYNPSHPPQATSTKLLPKPPSNDSIPPHLPLPYTTPHTRAFTVPQHPRRRRSRV